MDPTKIPNYEEVKKIVERLAYQYFWNDVKLFECALSHPVTWLVASAPYFAKSKRPQRWAAANLGTLMNAKNNPDFFRADKEDDLESRLLSILQTEGGENTPEFQKISALLQRILLQSYEWDKEKDAAAAPPQFNALNAGTLVYDSEARRLEDKTRPSDPRDAIDAIITVDEITLEKRSLSTCGFWYCD